LGRQSGRRGGRPRASGIGEEAGEAGRRLERSGGGVGGAGNGRDAGGAEPAGGGAAMDSITMRERDERVGTRERIKFGFFFSFS
jgi:hypothetical protein